MGWPQTQFVLNSIAPLSLLVPIAAPPQDLEDWVGQARTLVQRKMLKLDAGMRLATPDILLAYTPSIPGSHSGSLSTQKDPFQLMPVTRAA